MQQITKNITNLCDKVKITKNDILNLKEEINNTTLNDKHRYILEKIVKKFTTPYTKKIDKDDILKMMKDFNQETDTEVIEVENAKEEYDEHEEEMNDIENKIDMKVKKYKSYSKEHPMEYVSYHKKDKNYYLTDKTFSDKILSNVVIKAKEKLSRKFSNGITEFSGERKYFFEYQSKKCMIYINDKILLFDILHVINMLDIEERMSKLKYDEYSKDVTYYTFTKNKYGGYICRELISEKTMYDIILSSNSDFSKTFKKDVSNILVKLREEGKLFFSDDHKHIEYEAEPTIERKHNRLFDEGGLNVKIAKNALRTSIAQIPCIYLFTLGKVKELRNVMHIDAKYNDESYVAKYGRTDDLLRRTKQHTKTFGEMCPHMKLKYYAWIDDINHIAEAETLVKKYFQIINANFAYSDMKELVILNKDAIKNTKQYYEQLLTTYSSRLKSMISQYEKEIAECNAQRIKYKAKEHAAKLKNAKLQMEVDKQEIIIEQLKEMLTYEKHIHELEKKK